MYPFYHMKRRFVLPTALACFALLFFLPLSMLWARSSQETMAARLAPGVLRFHVIANSNSATDQALKLPVRQALLAAIEKGAAEELGPEPEKAELCAYINRHRRELEETAEACMAAQGYSYSAAIRLERRYFPTKQYAGLTFPCGEYDAVRVLLGEGKGRNWWCVLYPPLSFSGSWAAEETPDGADGARETGSETAAAALPLVPDSDCHWMSGRRRLVFGDGSSREVIARNGGETGGRDNGKNGDGNGNTQDTGEITVHVKSRLWEMLTSR